MKTEPASLASWIRNEHEEVNRHTERLQEKVAVIPRMVSPAWLEDVRSTFTDFAEHVRRHMALEEQGGFLSAVTDRRPSLSTRVDRLHAEHHDLNLMITQLAQALAEMTTERPLLARDFCRRAVALIDDIGHHEREENDLVEFAFTDDIGEKD